jgi:hypothetical protein
LLLRRLIVVALLFSALLIAAYPAAGGFAFDLRIPQERMNATASAKPPLERKTGPIVWRVDAVALTVLEKGRLGRRTFARGRRRSRSERPHRRQRRVGLSRRRVLAVGRPC